MLDIHFETSLQRIGRILARQYGIEVIFEGNIAKTDGKRIWLPNADTIDGNLKVMLNGFLDHEVGHCRDTEFGEFKNVISRFHQLTLNIAEDVRIEREMIKEYPGCELNLFPMNEQVIKELDKKWDKTPTALRLILGIGDLMKEGEVRHIDPDTERYINIIRDDAIALNDCTTTSELRIATEKIIKKIKEEREKENKEELDAGNEKGDMVIESESTPPAIPGDEMETPQKNGGSKSESDSKAEKGEGEGEEEGESGSDDDVDPSKGGSGEAGEAGGEGEGDDEKSGSGEGGSEGGSGVDDKFDGMMDEGVDEKDSEYDKHVVDAETFINDELRKHLTKELEKGSPHDHDFSYGWSTKPHIAITTRFDKVIDDTNSGSSEEYARLLNPIKEHIRPIRNALERVLKIKENARWIADQERGAINKCALGRFVTDPNFRTPFQDYTRTDVKNVAISLHIDMSGSMCGDKVKCAQQAALAMGEALNDICIPFEVTGFYTHGDNRISSFTRDIDSSGDGVGIERFNRTQEILVHHVFKNFDQSRLYGICKVASYYNNTDGETIRWAANRLIQRKERRKIMFVFTDGNPRDSSDRYVLNSDLVKAVKEIDKNGIEIVGVGIKHNDVERFYPNHIIIKDIAELPAQVMRKMSKMLEVA